VADKKKVSLGLKIARYSQQGFNSKIIK